jgi:hypothetical protein
MARQTRVAAVAVPRLPPAICGEGDSTRMEASARCVHQECVACGSGRALFALRPGLLVHMGRTPHCDAYGELIRNYRAREMVRFMSTPSNKPDSANPAMTLWLAIGSQRRRVADLERSSTCERSEPKPRAPEGRKTIARGKRGTSAAPGTPTERFIPSPPGRRGLGVRRASEPPQDEPSGDAGLARLFIVAQVSGAPDAECYVLMP